MKTVLRPRDHRDFLKNGFIVLKGAVPKKAAAAAAAFIEARLAKRRADDASLLFVAGPEIDACATKTALAAVAELFGEEVSPPPRGSRALAVPRRPRPGATWSAPFAHTDVDYPAIMPEQWAVTMFVFLTRVGSKEGAFISFAGSANRNRLLAATTPGALKALEGLPRYSGSHAELRAEPGDVLLYHHLLGHCGSENVAGAVTRHALKRGFHPRARLAPGAKPFARMSTIEKANSPRYLAALLGEKYPSPRTEPAARVSRALREGDALSADCAAHAVLRFDGRTWRFHADKRDRSVIRISSTASWSQWKEEGRLDLGPGTAHAIHVFHQGPEVVLFAGVAGGTVRVFKTPDLKTWSEAEPAPDLRAASGHFLGAYGTGADALVRVGVSASRPGEILCRETPVAELPRGVAARDAFMAPVLSEVSFALVVEATRLLYSLSPDGAAFPGPFTPLGSAESAPRQLRVYARARNYWLATYLAARGGRDRMLWGFIDWERAPARLEPITTAAALNAALEIVGLR